MTGILKIRTTSSGRSLFYIQLSYKDPRSQKWKTKEFSTGLESKNNKRKAESLLKSKIEEYSYLEEVSPESTNTCDSNVTLCDYLDLWLKDKKRDLKTSTYEAYSYRVSCMKKYFEKDNPKLIDITPRIMDAYFKYLLKFGKANKKNGEKGPLAVRSVRSYKSILYAVFQQACVIDTLIKANPVSGVSVHGKKNSDYSEDMLFLTEKEISDLLHFLSQKYPRLLGIAFMGAYYGLRRSEILGLKWSAIDFKSKKISINHTIVRVKTTVASDCTKTVSSRRQLNLFPTAEQCLLKIKKEQNENDKFFGNSYHNSEGYVFTWEDGRSYDPDYITRQFSKATKEFGRPEITLHKLRHSCASMLINKGWDIKKLQYWLGHTDTQTTLNIYSHFNRERLNTSANDLAEISMASADLFAG